MCNWIRVYCWLVKDFFQDSTFSIRQVTYYFGEFNERECATLVTVERSPSVAMGKESSRMTGKVNRKEVRKAEGRFTHAQREISPGQRGAATMGQRYKYSLLIRLTCRHAAEEEGKRLPRESPERATGIVSFGCPDGYARANQWETASESRRLGTLNLRSESFYYTTGLTLLFLRQALPCCVISRRASRRSEHRISHCRLWRVIRVKWLRHFNCRIYF